MSRAVRSGLDRLLAEGPAVAGLDSGARVALLGHPASVDGAGRHILEHLAAGTLPLTTALLFAPEHGLWGHEQDMEGVADGRDPWSGARVVSLYGEDPATLTPPPETLAGLDAVIVDLQDVGTRYYTFIYTMAHVMEAAGRAGLPVVVLDRPDPIGGHRVEGPVLHPELASFVGRYPLPVRHGMTVGELARMFAARFGAACELRVLDMHGWRRSMTFSETGLPWVPPSPNMPAVSTAQVYPGGCLVEGTNLSEGRGTTLPFELVGAPWLDAPRLAEALRREELPGSWFRPASFRPMFQKHAGRACQGVQIGVADPERFRAFETYLVLLREARTQAPDAFAWRSETYEFVSDRPAIDLLLGRADLRASIEAGAPLSAMERSWRDELDEFIELREEFLAYD